VLRKRMSTDPRAPRLSAESELDQFFHIDEVRLRDRAGRPESRRSYVPSWSFDRTIGVFDGPTLVGGGVPPDRQPRAGLLPGRTRPGSPDSDFVACSHTQAARGHPQLMMRHQLEGLNSPAVRRSAGLTAPPPPPLTAHLRPLRLRPPTRPLRSRCPRRTNACACPAVPTNQLRLYPHPRFPSTSARRSTRGIVPHLPTS